MNNKHDADRKWLDSNAIRPCHVFWVAHRHVNSLMVTRYRTRWSGNFDEMERSWCLNRVFARALWLMRARLLMSCIKRVLDAVRITAPGRDPIVIELRIWTLVRTLYINQNASAHDELGSQLSATSAKNSTSFLSIKSRVAHYANRI